MALALNNLKRVDMPLNKETKPNLDCYNVAVMYVNHYATETSSPEYERDAGIYFNFWKLCTTNDSPSLLSEESETFELIFPD